ncbi:odorant binding protein 12 [Andrena cerasifolii]|uniref:odorant binding protein 12 n=1 Tax=Andrena cerasifolii TaxID=2819439 RepID=UPI004037817D
MKNFILLACFLFCQEILARNLIAHYARVMHLPIEDVTECVEHIQLSIEMERQDSLEHNAKSEDNEANVGKYGCFIACLWQKNGMMTGSTLELQMIMDRINVKHPDNAELISLWQKNVETCAILVENMEDECEVALAFKACLKGARQNRAQMGV